MKAADAETIGGLPPSAFVLANKTQSTATGTKTASASPSPKNAPPAANPAVTGKGVLDFIPMGDTNSDIVDSLIFQKSSQIGFNTITPAALWDQVYPAFFGSMELRLPSGRSLPFRHTGILGF